MGNHYNLEQRVKDIKVDKSLEAGYPISVEEKGLSDSEISETELRIKREVAAWGDEELFKSYQLALQGAKAHIGSAWGFGNINDTEVIHYTAHTYALDTCRFTKEAIRKGVKKLKVKKDCRHSEYVNIEQVLLDAIRRVAVLEEYIRRN